MSPESLNCKITHANSKLRNKNVIAYLLGPDRMDVATDLKQTKQHVNETL